jgi:hypothetical protein
VVVRWFYLILAASSSGVAMVGAVAQLGEHLLCKQGVSGSIPLSSTNLNWCRDECLDDQYPLKKKRVCTLLLSGLCLFCLYCEEKIDLEASRYFGFLT